MPPTQQMPGQQPGQQRAGLPPWVARVLVGNWAGSALVAVFAVGVPGVLATILMLLMKPDGFGVDNTLTGIASGMTMAYGADFGAKGSTEVFGGTYSGHAGLGAMPLTLTVLGLLAAILVFRRVTARYTSAVDALLDAVRVALISGVAMMVIALIFRSSGLKFGDASGLVDEALSEVGDSHIDLKYGPGIAGSLFMTFLMLFVVLALSVFLRRDWLRARPLEVVHDWLAVPLRALAWLFALLPIAGIVVAIALFTIGDGTSEVTTGFGFMDWVKLGAAAVAWAGNLGMYGITLGAVGQLGGWSSASGESTSEARHLTYFTGDQVQEPGLWVTVALTPILLVAIAYFVTQGGWRSRATAPPAADRGPGLRNLAVWVVSMLVAVPLFVRMANVHAHGSVLGQSAHVTIGASGVGATFLLFAYALVVAFVVGLATRTIDGPALKAVLVSLNRTPATQPPPSQYGQPSAQQYGAPGQQYGAPGQYPGQAAHPAAPYQPPLAPPYQPPAAPPTTPPSTPPSTPPPAAPPSEPES
ncbi:hypothetical protein [Nocardioides sp.]|uniref:hypothetical protein n=1 Tax=Nocardioides sp. TaxID=35761 RepID=UPI0039E5C755